jgi:hypothetical protein
MANFGDLRLTVLGTVLQGKAQTGTELRFTRVAIGDGVLPDGSSLEDLTALIHEKMSVAINEILLNNDLATLTVAFSNGGLTSGFYIRELGIFANDPDAGEILYAVANAGVTPDYLPAAGANIVEEIFEVVTTVGSATNVTAIIDNSLTFVTHQQFAAHHHTPGTQAQIEAKDVVSVSKGLITAENVQNAIYQTEDMLIPAGDNYILQSVDGGYGGKFAADGLNLNITPLEAVIGRKYHSAAASSLSLNPRKASYIYATKNSNLDSVSPAIGRYDAVYPEADANTVSRWVFNSTGNISNSAVGNGLAVANDLAKNGTITQVDGWADYAMQSDGSTGYYISANSTGFPTGSVEREIDAVFTVFEVNDIICGYGIASAANYRIVLRNHMGNLKIDCSTNLFDTGLALETGKTYYIAMLYDTSKIMVYVNGLLIYTVATVLVTASTSMYVLRDSASASFSKGIVHYVELRNKMRTPQQIAQISNKLCLPCHYTGYQASYPVNDVTPGAHVYKFDDASGSTVTDENGTLNGTATGTTIVNSEIGLGKARKFNGSSDFITCPSINFGNSDWTIITVCKPSNAISGANKAIVTNFDSNAYGNEFLIGGNGELITSFNNNSSDYTSYSTRARVQNDTPNFLAWVVKNSVLVSMYVNCLTPEIFATIAIKNVSHPMYIGRWPGGNYFGGTLDYLAIIPRALSQPEIAQYYYALMKQSEGTLIDDCLPANSISLGFARTDSSKVIEYNDTDYKYMRNEGVTETEGNKRAFLGWKYFNSSSESSRDLIFNNPFGTRKIKTYFTWAQDANGTNESDVFGRWVSSSITYGIVSLNVSFQRISVRADVGGICYFNGTLQTSGYIGCYAEVL